VKAQLLTSAYGSFSHPTLLCSTGHSIILEVSHEGDYFQLLNSGQAFARLNKSFCSEARRLTDFGVRFRAYLLKDTWNTFGAAQNYYRPLATTFDVEVNVYSFRHHADRIGDIFSEAGFFLQRPTNDSADVLYYNPQILDLKGFEREKETSSKVSTQSSLVLMTQATALTPLERVEPEHEKNPTDLVESILDSLSHSTILHEIRPDKNRIRTELLPQEKNTDGDFRSRVLTSL
jgi:hypothetical protein